MTVGKLKELIRNLPDDAKVVVNYPEFDGDGDPTGQRTEGEVSSTMYFGRQRELDIEVELPPRYFWLHR